MQIRCTVQCIIYALWKLWANIMPKHIVNLLVLSGCILLLALGARYYLVDPSFYRFGHYRADAVPELAAGTPLYKGSDYCRSCHEKRNADWATGSHRTVQCEVCHGTDGKHPDDGKTLVPADKIKLCTTCHLAITGRPAKQPQIVLGEHPYPGEETPQCTTCHNPHSPGEMKEETTSAEAGSNVPAATSKCSKCHGEQGEGRKKNPALAGMDPAVFIERINQYKSGARKYKMMNKITNSLSDAEIEELAKYYQGLPKKTSE